MKNKTGNTISTIHRENHSKYVPVIYPNRIPMLKFRVKSDERAPRILCERIRICQNLLLALIFLMLFFVRLPWLSYLGNKELYANKGTSGESSCESANGQVQRMLSINYSEPKYLKDNTRKVNESLHGLRNIGLP